MKQTKEPMVEIRLYVTKPGVHVDDNPEYVKAKGWTRIVWLKCEPEASRDRP